MPWRGQRSTGGETVNVGVHRAVSLNQLVQKINHLLGTDAKPIYADPRPGDIRHSLADIRKAKKLIGYEPVAHFEEGLQRSIEYYRQHPA